MMATTMTTRGRRIASLVLLCALDSGGTGEAAWALSPPEVYAKVAPSVWRIATYDACCQRLTKSGSARQESWTSRTIRVPGSDN